MKTPRTFLALVAALSLGLGTAALAGPPPERFHGEAPHPGPFAHLLAQVELTEAQLADLRALREEIRAGAEELRQQLDANREAFKAEMASGNPDPVVLHDLLDAQSELRTAFQHAELDRFLEIYATFTPEQRADLAEAIESAPERPSWGDRGPGDGPGPHPMEPRRRGR